jgi:hypothetical protein
LYGIEKFTYVAETNSYQCPEGKRLTYVGINAINRTHVYVAYRRYIILVGLGISLGVWEGASSKN